MIASVNMTKVASANSSSSVMLAGTLLVGQARTTCFFVVTNVWTTALGAHYDIGVFILGTNSAMNSFEKIPLGPTFVFNQGDDSISNVTSITPESHLISSHTD